MKTSELTTPALLVDARRLEGNIGAMAEALPGARLRPHVKAHKCTGLAKRQLAAGHSGVRTSAATPKVVPAASTTQACVGTGRTMSW